MNKIIALLFLVCLATTTIYAQQLQLLSKPKNRTIQLRWAPSDYKTWEQGNKMGYTLERTLLRRNGKSNTKEKSQLLAKTTFLPKEKWEEMIETNEYAKIIKGYFFDEPVDYKQDTATINNVLKARFIYTMLTADLSFQIAQGMGIAWIDSDVKSNELYRYKVYLNDASGKPTKVVGISSNGIDENQHIELPDDLTDDDYVDSTVTLKWTLSDRTVYSAYNVERSDDGGRSFRKINDLPIFPTGSGKNFNIVVYSDKVPVLFKNYLYRVRGIDPFSDESSPSNVVKLFAYQTRLSAVHNPSYELLKDEKIFLTWEYPDSLLVNLKGFNVYRLNKTEEEKINTSPVENYKKYFIDKIRQKDENIYYLIKPLDLRNKETSSDPLIVMLQDSIPPKKVTNLKGEINKEGIVKINWSKSPDWDVYSYTIFRSDGFKKELYNIGQVFSADSSFTDTVRMDTKTKYVYYMIAPIDYHINSCWDNDTLRLVRPDVLKPDPPSFTSASYTDTTLIVRWVYSKSEDVVKYNLYKSFMPDTAKNLVLSFASADSLTKFVDMDWEEEKPIRYILEAIDGAELSSGDSANIILTVPKPLRRSPVNDLMATFDKKEKQVTLSWKYPTKHIITKYMLFRRVLGEENFTKLTTTDGSTVSYIDNDLKSDTSYEYMIYAHFNDKTVTSKGKHVTVKVK